jgi:hypothetical protein
MFDGSLRFEPTTESTKIAFINERKNNFEQQKRQMEEGQRKKDEFFRTKLSSSDQSKTGRTANEEENQGTKQRLGNKEIHIAIEGNEVINNGLIQNNSTFFSQ